MAARAFFGRPGEGPAHGGLQVTVHVVPVFEGRLVAFDVTAAGAHGRWLPWAVMEFGQNPYEAASTLADDWCDLPLADLVLVDVLSLDTPEDGWELAIVFRAELTGAPLGDAERKPFTFAPGEYDSFGPFDPVDLERWVYRVEGQEGGSAARGTATLPERAPGGRPALLF